MVEFWHFTIPCSALYDCCVNYFFQLILFPVTKRGNYNKNNPITSHLAEPIGGEITIASEPEMSGNSLKTAKEKALTEQLCSSKFSRSSDKNQKVHCYYTSVPRLIKHKGMCATELTSLNLDKVSSISRFYLIMRTDAH